MCFYIFLTLTFTLHNIWLGRKKLPLSQHGASVFLPFLNLQLQPSLDRVHQLWLVPKYKPQSPAANGKGSVYSSETVLLTQNNPVEWSNSPSMIKLLFMSIIREKKKKCIILWWCAQAASKTIELDPVQSYLDFIITFHNWFATASVEVLLEFKRH